MVTRISLMPNRPMTAIQEADTAQEVGEAESRAQLARHRVHADAGQQQAQRHGDDDLCFLAPQPDGEQKVR
jgi:hypothetical protein